MGAGCASGEGDDGALCAGDVAGATKGAAGDMVGAGGASGGVDGGALCAGDAAGGGRATVTRLSDCTAEDGPG
mgnify:CR=1 FL=1